MSIKNLGHIYNHNKQIANGKENPTKERSEIMALSRKFLTALGLEGDKVDEIITAHSETVDALKEERDKALREAENNKTEVEKYKAEADKLPALQKEVEDLKKTIEEAEQADGENAWKVKYDAMKEEKEQLQSEFDTYKNDITAKETKASKEKAYRKLLKDTGVSDKRIDAVIKVTDLDKIELDDEGKKCIQDTLRYFGKSSRSRKRKK